MTIEKVAENVATNIVTNNLDGFVEQLTTVTKVITDEVVKKAPEAAELMLNALQLRAGIDLLFGVAAAIGVYVCVKTAKKSFNIAVEADCASPAELIAVISTASSIVAAAILFFISLSYLSTQGIIMAISPEAGLALEIFDKVVK